MISKTKLQERIIRKRNPEIVSTLIACKKNGEEKWMRVAQLLSSQQLRKNILNIEEINKIQSKKEIILIPGKILSQGSAEDLTSKKIKIVALSFSNNAKEKLNKSKIKFNTILEEIKQNPSGENIEILEK